MNKSTSSCLLTFPRHLGLCAGLAVALYAGAVSGATTLTANDAAGTTSFNVAGHWSDGLAPYAGNGYSTLGYLLRTPSAAGNYTFAGDSLTVGGGTGGGAFSPGVANNNAFINKTPTAPIVTVNNLILDGSSIRDGMGSSESWTLAGHIFVTPNGGNLICQERFNVDSAISGSGPLYIGDNGSGEAARTVYINSPLNTYNGSITLMGSSADRARITFASNSVMNFTIGASGVNNAILGTGTAAFNGNFAFNLAGASYTWGSSWNIVNVGGVATTFGDTFTVSGFTDMGTYWTTLVNGTTYTFNELTGVLSIPEPGTGVLLMGGLGLFLALRRRA
jgi:hypothetical protein